MASAAADIPKWMVSGGWFDVCKCNIPCPCEFAQTPTFGDCDGVLAYHIHKGQYGETSLDGLNVLGLGSFTGNIWAGDGKTKINLGFFFDERADQKQRDALQMIFTGKAGGFMAELAKLIGEVRGLEFAPIKLEVADNLGHWSAEIPGKVVAKAEALSGPMTPPGKRVITLNPPVLLYVKNQCNQNICQANKLIWVDLVLSFKLCSSCSAIIIHKVFPGFLGLAMASRLKMELK
jgi:hypothetical protein